MTGIPKRIFFGFLVYSSISLLVSVISFELFRRMEATEKMNSYINTLFNKTVHAIKLGQDFMLYEIYQDSFFQSGHSISLDKYEALLKDIDAIQLDISAMKNIKRSQLTKEVAHLDMLMQRYDSIFRQIVQKETMRGYKEYGMEGKMKRSIYELEINPKVDMNKILQIKNYEKNYLLRKDTFYIANLRLLCMTLDQDLVANEKIANTEKKHLRNSLSEYTSAFMQIVNLETEIGHNRQVGLSAKLKKTVDEVDEAVDKINILAIRQKDEINTTIQLVFLSIITVSVLLILLMAIAFKAMTGF
jgi:hypothetical protein